MTKISEVNKKTILKSSPITKSDLPIYKKQIYRTLKEDAPTLICLINPKNFIYLTVGNITTKENVMQAANISLLEYTHEHVKIPRLKMFLYSGRIISHDGRHRAAMLIKASKKRFPVFITLYVLQKIKGVWKYSPIHYPNLSKSDLPDIAIGQFLPNRKLRISNLITQPNWVIK